MKKFQDLFHLGPIWPTLDPNVRSMLFSMLQLNDQTWAVGFWSTGICQRSSPAWCGMWWIGWRRRGSSLPRCSTGCWSTQRVTRRSTSRSCSTDSTRPAWMNYPQWSRMYVKQAIIFSIFLFQNWILFYLLKQKMFCVTIFQVNVLDEIASVELNIFRLFLKVGFISIF